MPIYIAGIRSEQTVSIKREFIRDGIRKLVMFTSLIQGRSQKILPGLCVAFLTGMTAYTLHTVTGSPLIDPLLLALIAGIILRTAIGEQERLIAGFIAAPAIFIPIGIIFYGFHNLNFVRLTEVNAAAIVLLIGVMAVYFSVIVGLGKLLKQKKQITYLTAAGSAICGASAIAVTSPAVDADSEDISISLLAVAITAFAGVAIILPFLHALLHLTFQTFCELSGSVVQFTGLVKFSPLLTYVPQDILLQQMQSLSLSLKAVRYLALLVAIPLFASFIRRKLSIPWFLWAFLISGLTGTWIYSTDRTFFSESLEPYVQPLHTIVWSIAMAAVGLNANVKSLLSIQGSKALVMAFAGFLAATVAFLIGNYILVLH